MCGIAGTIDATAERAAARVGLLNDARAHRSPDHSVITRVGGIALGNSPAYRIPKSCLPNTEWLLASMRATLAAAVREHRRGCGS